MNPVKRYEYKYYVPVDMIEFIQRDISPFIKYDKFADIREDKRYTVRSIYYDSIRLDAYHEKVEGLPVRKKIRIRGYNEHESDSYVFLEIKRKYDNRGFKNRSMLFFHNLPDFLDTGRIHKYIIGSEPGGKSFLDATKFYYQMNINSLRPVVLVTYDRIAYSGLQNNDTRITFDMNLRSKLMPRINELYSESSMVKPLNGFVIMEVKFSKGLPHWVIKMLQKYELQRRAISKYTISIDSHRLFNPINKKIEFTKGVSLFN